MGGSAGSTAGNGGSTTGNGGNGGNGGAPELPDGGPDGAAHVPTDLCVPGSLTAYCADFPCPAFADARQAARQGLGFSTPAAAIVQRSCVARDGSARVSVAGDYLSWTRTFIYDAETHQLTGVVLTNDLGLICDGTGIFRDFLSGLYGERAPDCEWSNLPAACNASDAGVGDAGISDAGDAGPLECVLSP